VKKTITGGMLIAFEGGEAVGKTTQSRALLYWLMNEAGYETMLTREPGATHIGWNIRQMILDPVNRGLDDRAEALLYAADRAQHVRNVIRPNMENGLIVITDRYSDSSVAYQGIARGLGAERIAEISSWASYGLVPHLTIVLDMDPVRARARQKADPDRIEAEPMGFHYSVRGAFRGLAKNAPDRYLVVDAAQHPATVTGIICTRVSALLAAQSWDEPLPSQREET
jgi:dTMP kinase